MVAADPRAPTGRWLDGPLAERGRVRDPDIPVGIEDVGLAQAVRLPRIDHEVCVDAVPLQAAVELLALADRIGLIVSPRSRI